MANTKVTTNVIADDAITGAKIADDAINSEHYTDGSIDTAHIADDQVTLAKMAGLARGKIIYGDSSGNPAALAVGSNGQVLKSDGTDISWGTDSSNDRDGAAVFNESGAAVDFRIEGDTVENLFFVDGSADKIGIGTNSPDAAVLHVFQGSAGTVAPHSSGDDLVVEHSGDGGISIVTPNANTGRILWTSPATTGDIGARIMYQQSTNLMSIGTGGGQIFCKGSDVGIGTTSPSRLLDITSTANNVYPLKIRGDIDNNGGYTGIVFGYETDTTAYEKAAIHVEGTSGNVQPDMHFLLHSGANNSNATISDARLSILNGGNVGIGVADPAELLHIKGSNAAQKIRVERREVDGILSDNDEIGALEFWTNDDTYASGASALRAKIMAEVQNTSSGTNLQFWTGNSTSAAAERMRILADGKVGIGSTSPTTSLQIDPTADTYTPTAYNDGQALRIRVANAEGNYAGIGLSHAGQTEAFLGLVRATATSDIADLVWQNYNGTDNAYQEQFRISEAGLPQFPRMGAGSGENAVQWWSGGGRAGGMLIYVASSKKYKKDITDCKVDSSKIYNLEAKSFKWNEKSVHEDKQDWGMIAEDVIEHIPELGTYDEEGEIQGLQYEKLSVLLLEEIKKLEARIATLEG